MHRPSPLSHDRSGHHLVLVVESERLIRELIAQTLHELGVQTRQAPSGVDALSLLTREVTLLIVDQHLEDMSGADLLDLLVEGEWDGFRILRTGPERWPFGDLRTPFLKKPYSKTDLRQHVRTLLNA